MVNFSGQELFSLPVPILHQHLADTGWLARSLPDAEVLEATLTQAKWKIRPKFSFATGYLESHAELLQAHPEQIQYQITSKGIGSSSIVVAELRLIYQEQGTAVRWVGEIRELGGLLKLVPKGLIQAAAQKVIADVWQAIREKLPPA